MQTVIINSFHHYAFKPAYPGIELLELDSDRVCIHMDRVDTLLVTRKALFKDDEIVRFEAGDEVFTVNIKELAAGGEVLCGDNLCFILRG